MILLAVTPDNGDVQNKANNMAVEIVVVMCLCLFLVMVKYTKMQHDISYKQQLSNNLLILGFFFSFALCTSFYTMYEKTL